MQIDLTEKAFPVVTSLSRFGYRAEVTSESDWLTKDQYKPSRLGVKIEHLFKAYVFKPTVIVLSDVSLRQPDLDHR